MIIASFKSSIEIETLLLGAVRMISKVLLHLEHSVFHSVLLSDLPTASQWQKGFKSFPYRDSISLSLKWG